MCQGLIQGLTHWFVEMVAHRVSKSADGIIQDEQVLGLVLGEGRHQHLQTNSNHTRTTHHLSDNAGTCRMSPR